MIIIYGLIYVEDVDRRKFLFLPVQDTAVLAWQRDKLPLRGVAR